MGSQCNDLSNWLAWDHLGAWGMIQAALFCTRCNFLTVQLAALCNTALQ